MNDASCDSLIDNVFLRAFCKTPTRASSNALCTVFQLRLLFRWLRNSRSVWKALQHGEQLSVLQVNHSNLNVFGFQRSNAAQVGEDRSDNAHFVSHDRELLWTELQRDNLSPNSSQNWWMASVRCISLLSQRSPRSGVFLACREDLIFYWHR